jgi:hypothetical protein
VEFDIPGDTNGVIPTSINNDGIVAGYFKDASLNQHGFVRAVSGDITVIDEPKGNGSPLVTSADSINSDGSITGTYLDAKNERHGFVRMVTDSASSASGSDTTVSTPTSGESDGTATQSQSQSTGTAEPTSGGGAMEPLWLIVLLASCVWRKWKPVTRLSRSIS